MSLLDKNLAIFYKMKFPPEGNLEIEMIKLIIFYRNKEIKLFLILNLSKFRAY